MSQDRATLASDGCDAQPITVFAVDSAGRAVPTANLAVEFEIEGGRISVLMQSRARQPFGFSDIVAVEN